MKISELRPCDLCGGQIVPMFYVIRISMAMFVPQQSNQVLGLMQMFGGIGKPGALAIAETMAPKSDCIKILGDEKKELMTELIICWQCHSMKDINLAMLAAKVQAKFAAKEEETDG